LTTSIKKAESVDNLIAIQNDTSELHEINISFYRLMEKFEKTTDELQRRVFELFTIKELTEVASRSLDFDGLLSVLLEKAMTVTQAKIGSVFLAESENQLFRVVASKGLDYGIENDSFIKTNESLARTVIAKKKTLRVENIETDSRTLKPNDPEYDSPSFLCMPIFVREDLIAVLNLSHKETKQAFDTNDEHILSIMIGEIGFALENAQLHSRVVEKEKLQSVIEISGAVCHEMNQPLMAILGYSELILADLSEDNPLKEKFVKITDQVDKLGQITQKLMSITKYQTKDYLDGKIIDIYKSSK
jgi:transcriptional regulator with GAF, ATPase, and Fis domain